jgi:cyclic pyranopterin phosphate synthase
MPIGDLLFWDMDKMVSSEEIQSILSSQYTPCTRKSGGGNGPARYYQLEGGTGSLGFISPMSHHFCQQCNRIRLTADGKLRGCLYDKQEIDLKQALLSGASDGDLEELFLKAIQRKPAGHQMNNGWGQENSRKMFQIGVSFIGIHPS